MAFNDEIRAKGHQALMWDKERRYDRIEELTRQGHTARFIAEELGITEKTVVAARRARGLSQSIKPPMTEDEIDYARKLLDEGCPYQEVARTLGRSFHTIRRRLPGYSVLTRAEVCEMGRQAQKYRGVI